MNYGDWLISIRRGNLDQARLGIGEGLLNAYFKQYPKWKEHSLSCDFDCPFSTALILNQTAVFEVLLEAVDGVEAIDGVLPGSLSGAEVAKFKAVERWVFDFFVVKEAFIKRLLAHGWSFRYALFRQIYENDIEGVRAALLGEACPIDQLDRGGQHSVHGIPTLPRWSPIAFAAVLGRLEILKLFAADVFRLRHEPEEVVQAIVSGQLRAIQGDSADASPLLMWSLEEFERFVKNFEKLESMRGSDLSEATLRAAVLSGDAKTVEWLLKPIDQGGAGIAVPHKYFQLEACGHALGFGYLDVLKVLERHQFAFAMPRCGMGCSFLTIAAATGQRHLLEYLWSLGEHPWVAPPATDADAGDWSSVVFIAAVYREDPVELGGRGCQSSHFFDCGCLVAATFDEQAIIEVMQLLLAHGVNLTVDMVGMTALHCAARSGFSKVVQWLLTVNQPVASAQTGGQPARVFDPTLKDDEGKTPFLHAAENGHADVLAVLHAHEASLVGAVDSSGANALHLAARKGCLEAVNCLLLFGQEHIAIDAMDSHGRRPLYYAAERLHIEVVRKLESAGADVNDLDQDGHTVLEVALPPKRKDSAATSYRHHCLDFGSDAKPTVYDYDNYEHKERYQVLKLFLWYDPAFERKDGRLMTLPCHREGDSLLHYLVEEGDVPALALLCDHLHEEVREALVNMPDTSTFGHHQTPLLKAALSGDLDAVKLLCKMGAVKDVRDACRRNVFHFASIGDHVDVLAFLVDGLDAVGDAIDGPNDEGEPPFWLAIQHGSLAVLQWLHDAGARIIGEDAKGLNALHLAARSGHPEVVKWLLSLRHGYRPLYGTRPSPAYESGRLINPGGGPHARHQGHNPLRDGTIEFDPQQVDSKGFAAIHHAAEAGHASVLAVLYAHDPSLLGATTSGGATVLHVAARAGLENAVDWILSHGEGLIDINSMDSDGRTALYYAADRWFIHIVRKLELAGGRINHVDKHAHNVYEVALASDCRPCSLGSLCSRYPFDFENAIFGFSLRDVEGDSAHQNIGLEVLRLILWYSPLLKRSDRRLVSLPVMGDKSLWHDVAIEGDELALDMIYESLHPRTRPAIVDLRCSGSARTAFLLAAQKGNLAVLRKLDGWGATKDLFDNNRCNAFHLAASGAHLSTLQWLYPFGEWIYDVDCDGLDALCHVFRRGPGHYSPSYNLVEWLLLEAGFYLDGRMDFYGDLLGCHVVTPRDDGNPFDDSMFDSSETRIDLLDLIKHALQFIQEASEGPRSVQNWSYGNFWLGGLSINKNRDTIFHRMTEPVLIEDLVVLMLAQESLLVRDINHMLCAYTGHVKPSGPSVVKVVGTIGRKNRSGQTVGAHCRAILKNLAFEQVLELLLRLLDGKGTLPNFDVFNEGFTLYQKQYLAARLHHRAHQRGLSDHLASQDAYHQLRGLILADLRALALEHARDFDDLPSQQRRLIRDLARLTEANPFFGCWQRLEAAVLQLARQLVPIDSISALRKKCQLPQLLLVGMALPVSRNRHTAESSRAIFSEKDDRFKAINGWVSEAEQLIKRLGEGYGPVITCLQELISLYRQFIADMVACCQDAGLSDTEKDAKLFSFTTAPWLLYADGVHGLPIITDKSLMASLTPRQGGEHVSGNNTLEGLGGHVVRHCRFAGVDLHFKYADPHDDNKLFLGVEHAVTALHALLAGSQCAMAPMDLVKLAHIEPRHEILAVVSRTVQGINLDTFLRHYVKRHPGYLRQFDAFAFSAMFMTTLFTRPSDAKPENFIVQCVSTESGSCFRAVGIDNDHAFAGVRLLRPDEPDGCFSSEIKSVFLFFPQMNDPIDPQFADHFLSQSPEQFMIHWLSALDERNQWCQDLCAQGAFTVDDLAAMQLPIRFNRLFREPVTIYRQFLSIRQFILDQRARAGVCTHNDIFKWVYPRLASYYDRWRKEPGLMDELPDWLHDRRGGSSGWGDCILSSIECLYPNPSCPIQGEGEAFDGQPDADQYPPPKLPSVPKDQYRDRDQSLTEAIEDWIGCLDFGQGHLHVNQVAVLEDLKRFALITHLSLFRADCIDRIMLLNLVISFKWLEVLCLDSCDGVGLLDVFDCLDEYGGAHGHRIDVGLKDCKQIAHDDYGRFFAKEGKLRIMYHDQISGDRGSKRYDCNPRETKFFLLNLIAGGALISKLELLFLLQRADTVNERYEGCMTDRRVGDYMGFTLLHILVHRKDTEMLRRLFELSRAHGIDPPIDPSVRDRKYNETPLEKAEKEGFVDGCELLRQSWVYQP